MGKSAKHASRSGTKRKTRLKGGRLIDAQLSNWPVTPRADLNLGSVRFFVVVVGRIVVFMSLFLVLFSFSLFCLSHEVVRKIRREVTREIWIFFKKLAVSPSGDYGMAGPDRLNRKEQSEPTTSLQTRISLIHANSSTYS